MPARTVAQKMGIRPGWRAYFHGAPAVTVAGMELPHLAVETALAGAFDYLHLFVVTQDDMRRQLPLLEPHLATQGKLWLSWPKGGGLGSDLRLPTVIEIGYACGLVESTCLRLDDVWSGLRFTRPRQGVTYCNSYGRLPD